MNDEIQTATEPLSFTYTLQKEDFIKTLRAFMIQQKSTIWIGIFLVVMSACSTASIFMTSTFPTTAIIFPFLAFLYVLMMFFLIPLIVGNKAEKNVSFQSQLTWALEKGNINIKSRSSQTNYGWDTFHEVLETNEHFLFVYTANRNLFYIVPKRALASDAELGTFRKLVKENAAGYREIRSINLPNVPAVLLYIIIGVTLLSMIGIAFLSAYLQ